MNFAKRFKSGLDIGLKSFGLLWKHKYLLIYLGAPVLIGITIELTVFNLFSFSPSSSAVFMRGLMVRIWSTFGWIKHIGLLVTQLVKLFVLVYAGVALTRHTSKIMKRSTTTIKKMILSCLPKIRSILLWASSSTIFFIFINQIDAIMNKAPGKTCFLMSAIVAISLRLTWSLATLFVVQIIALENISLLDAFKKSPDVTKTFFAQYLGAITWLCLVGILSFTPFLLLPLRGPLGLTVVYAILALIGCILSSTHNILKTNLYLEYKK